MIKYNWQKLIEQQIVSNLSIEEFCKLNGISNSAFYRNKKILSEGKFEPKEKRKQMDFARIEVKDKKEDKKEDNNTPQKALIEQAKIRLHTPEGYTLEVFL